jgi:hypothetical protein
MNFIGDVNLVYKVACRWKVPIKTTGGYATNCLRIAGRIIRMEKTPKNTKT